MRWLFIFLLGPPSGMYDLDGHVVSLVRHRANAYTVKWYCKPATLAVDGIGVSHGCGLLVVNWRFTYNKPDYVSKYVVFGRTLYLISEN